ncbi:MAG: c-type cytochrome [Rhodothermales bacterium]
MRSFFTASLLLASALLGADALQAQSRTGYDQAYIGDPLPDPLMQHNKETFVLYGCAYCHGLYLKPVGEAADLRISPVVGADVDANLISPILRNGIPQTPKSSPMPQFSDLSESEIRAIAAYIHYARAEVRYRDLMAAPASAGDASAGRMYVEQNCASCHTVRGDLAGIGGKYDAASLRKQVLQPARFEGAASFAMESRQNSVLKDGRAKHQALLENYAEPDVSNVVAFLRTLK